MWPKEVPSSTPVVFQLVYCGTTVYRMKDLFEWEDYIETLVVKNKELSLQGKPLIEIKQVLYYYKNSKGSYVYESYTKRVLDIYKELFYNDSEF